jgi:2-methylisocitrate lyase-like PEP mutase family enzyme
VREKAELLRSLHVPGKPIVLVNAWDCATARILERSGAPAVATTSAGVAFSLGYPDGERIPRELMLEAVARIAASVRVPVTADSEAGYGPTPEDAARTADGVLRAGAVGMNLEDGTGDPARPLAELARQVEKIRAVRETGERAGVPLVINARTDAYLDRVGTPEEMFAETLRRGEAYRAAGADCVFVPGVTDVAVIGELVRRLACPVNVLAGAGSPSIGQLASLGLARVSLGSGPMRAAVTLFRRLAEEVATRGTYEALTGALSHLQLNDLMAGP